MLIIIGGVSKGKKRANKACTGLVGTVRLFEHYQRPEHFSARRENQRPAHKPVTQAVVPPCCKR